MGPRADTIRERIISAADQLFYEKGYEQTSFADIAQAVNISRGNFYYHFKTKDDILDAVIDARLAKTSQLLQAWETEATTPAERIRRFIHILIANGGKIQRYGCPVGTLCTELAKLDHVSKDEANKLFILFRRWLSQQFTLLGREADADDLAMHLLARSQGVATLATAFQDEKFLNQEVKQLDDWLDQVVSSTKQPAASVIEN